MRLCHLDDNGYTVGCLGCISILRGTARQTHTQACRRRMEEVLKNTVKAKKAKKRMSDFIKFEMDKDDEAQGPIEKNMQADEMEGDGNDDEGREEKQVDGGKARESGEMEVE